MTAPNAPFPFRLESPSGLAFQINANGSIHRIDHGDVLLNLFLGNEAEGGPANLYLRRHGEIVEVVPLLGPRSPSAVDCGAGGLRVSGVWRGIRYAATLVLAESAPAWFWHVDLENIGEEAATVDLIHAQDLGLAHYWAVRLNEYYVSQYVDHTPLSHSQSGWVLATRQNQAMGGRYPWCVTGALERGASYATDALQVHGLASRAGFMPAGVAAGLPGTRRQHEHSMAAVQDAPVWLAPGERASRGFFGGFAPDHPAASSAADLAFVDQVLALPEAVPPVSPFSPSASVGTAGSLFATAPLLETLDLGEAEILARFGPELREAERDAEGRLLSFFAGERRHAVLKAKELRVLRPHGHILRSGCGLTPDEAALTSTTWMGGVFHSMVTQGHVSINRFLSTTHSYLGLFRSHGQRVFAELNGVWHLLDVPSAYEMAPDGCRWLYRHANGLIEVRAAVASGRHALSLAVAVLEGPPLRFLVSHHIALNGDDGSRPGPARYAEDAAGVFVRAAPDCDVGWRFPEGGFRIDPQPGAPVERIGGDELLYPDGQSRNQPFLCFVFDPAAALGLAITGHLIAAEPVSGGIDPARYWSDVAGGLRVQPPTASPLAGDVARLAELLPWLAHNALIHYLAPRGLEQYSGGGWGTRDVTQGPVEMLLGLGRPEPIRELLARVFKQQNPDGDWPQWFMFFDRERGIRPGDSHGDIVFWPLLALAQYLLATEDAAFLDAVLPFFHPDGDDQAEQAPLAAHVERALGVMERRRIPGTRLAAYGHGDWNDSLQPVDPAMRERLCSSWTVTLHYQTLVTLGLALRRLGRIEPAARFAAMAAEVLADFQKLLVVDGVLAGFAYFQEGGGIDYLLHPRDRGTGLRYSLLPMIHAIANGMLSPEQAARHLELIEAHLLGPDGARLFDQPMTYRGGLQKFFQRAESSTYFGREIGLMYTHAHLRYAEALARHGDAVKFFEALCKANPIGLQAHVPSARLRQVNCYYSSSDADFADRYQAYAVYFKAMAGEVGFEGGWRVYSSGAGIGLGLILRCLFGLRREQSALVVDPVMPPELDGLRVELELAGKPVAVSYRVGAQGCGVRALTLNGAELPFAREANPYRTGGAEVPMAELRARLADGGNALEVAIG
jgi:cellobiose phosphorylase